MRSGSDERLPKKGCPRFIYYKANIITYIRANRYKHTHHDTQHIPKARYKVAGHRHTTRTTTKQTRDEPRRTTWSHRGGVRRTKVEPGLQDGASQKGTTTDSRHRSIRRSSFHPEPHRGVGAPRRSLQEGYDIRGRRRRRPV